MIALLPGDSSVLNEYEWPSQGPVLAENPSDTLPQP